MKAVKENNLKLVFQVIYKLIIQWRTKLTVMKSSSFCKIPIS